MRDGVHWPEGIDERSVWMSPDQEKAIVGFVENGRALIESHNCLDFIPLGGPYLELLEHTITFFVFFFFWGFLKLVGGDMWTM